MSQKSSARRKIVEPELLPLQKSPPVNAPVVVGEMGSPVSPFKIYCGIDNGISGSVAVITPGLPAYWEQTPKKRCRNYQKVEKHLHRVDSEKLFDILYSRVTLPIEAEGSALVLVERPYCNPQGFNASLLAARALEATLVVLDLLQLEYRFVDSKEWQTALLPSGTIGRDELKQASFEVGKVLFPDVKFKKDADSLLMAEWARRNQL